MILKFQGKPGSGIDYTLVDNIKNITLQTIEHKVGTTPSDLDCGLFMVYGDKDSLIGDRFIHQLICEDIYKGFFHIQFDCKCYVCNDNGKTIETIYEMTEEGSSNFCCESK